MDYSLFIFIFITSFTINNIHASLACADNCLCICMLSDCYHLFTLNQIALGDYESTLIDGNSLFITMPMYAFLTAAFIQYLYNLPHQPTYQKKK